MDSEQPSVRPLDNIRVLSLGQYMSAPYCTMLLADMGAEVIKIEQPGSGDPRRSIAPFPAGADHDNAIGGGFMAYNRNKKSVVLNLRSSRGVDIFHELATQSDVVVENMRPGSADKLGVGYDSLQDINSKLIYAAISGFGQLDGYRGPLSDRPALDIVVEAMSGIMQQVGFEDRPPQWTIYGLGDLYSGLVTSYSIVLALFMREMTDKGQFIDTAMYDSMLSLNERMVMLHSFTDEMQPRGYMRHQGPRGAYEAADGYIALNIPNDAMWERLCQVMGREDLLDDTRTIDGHSRAEHREFVRSVLESWLRNKSREDAVSQLNENGVPAGPVQSSSEIFADPQVTARNMLVDIEDPEYGTYSFARTPMRLSDVPEIDTNPAPRHGQHTREVIGDILAVSPTELDSLVADGIIENSGK